MIIMMMSWWRKRRRRRRRRRRRFWRRKKDGHAKISQTLQIFCFAELFFGFKLRLPFSTT
jgi:amino acid transporter